jgi:hypothetical protein
MKKGLLYFASILLAGALLAGSACGSFKVNVPPGQVLCKTDSDCPNGSRCEFVSQDVAPIDLRVCCVNPGCSQHISPDALANAVAATGYEPDASPDVSAASAGGNP